MTDQQQKRIDQAEEAAEYAEACATAIYEAAEIAMSAYHCSTPATDAAAAAAKTFDSIDRVFGIARESAKKAREHANSVMMMEVTK